MLRPLILSYSLVYSIFIGLVVISGISTTSAQLYAQETLHSQSSLQNSFPPQVSAAMLFNPSVVQKANHPLDQSVITHDSTKGMIQLKSKFLGSQKFIYGGKEPQNVYGFWGISFKPEFQETMSIHPSALREAKKAYPYNALRLAGTIGLVGMSAKLFFDAVNKSQKISDGELVDAGLNMSDVVLTGVAGTVAIVSGILGKKHLKNGVEIFNDRQK